MEPETALDLLPPLVCSSGASAEYANIEEHTPAEAKAERMKKNKRCPVPGIDIRHTETANGRTDVVF